MTATTSEKSNPSLSLYAPEVLKTEEMIHAQVTADLGHLGEAAVVEGSITATPHHGVILDGVVAEVKVPRLHKPLRIEVLQGEGSSLRYRNIGTKDSWVTPADGNSYGSLPAEHERSVIEAAFAHWDAHPAIQAAQEKDVPEPRPARDFDIQPPLMVGGVFLMAILAVAAILWELTGGLDGLKGLVILVLSGVVASGVTAFIAREIYLESKDRRRVDQERSAVRKENNSRRGRIASWNNSTGAVFRDAFPSSVERAVFLDRLITLSEKLGLGNPNSFRMANTTSSHLSAPCVFFSADEEGEDRGRYLFDGRNVFRVHTSEHSSVPTIQAL